MKLGKHWVARIERSEDPESWVPAVNEISTGSRCKYRLDKTTGQLELARALPRDVAFPMNYGFIPHTRCCADDEETDDPDVYRIDSAAVELDLRPAIREQWILAAPTYALCREDCKGFCPRCGADLNAGPHECSHDEMDPRWEALRKLKESSK